MKQRQKPLGPRAKKRWARKRRRILLVTAISTFVAALVFFGVYEANSLHALRNREKVQASFNKDAPTPEPTTLAYADSVSEETIPADPAETNPPQENPSATSQSMPTAEQYLSARFVELAADNPDIVGWIEAGADISEPVVCRDNDYYINHDFYGKTSSSGTVFLDSICAEWDVEQYKIIYGHNMRNGTMFGRLDDYQMLSYLKDNSQITYYSAYNDEVVQYAPFAVIIASMNADDEHYFFLRQMDAFRDPVDSQGVSDFLEEITQRSMFSFDGVDVSADDNILCLVTCTYDYSNARLMLFCRELREGESAEDMVQLIRDTTVKK